MIGAEEKEAALGRVATATDYAAFGECDLVVEAASENEAVKRAIFAELSAASEARAA